MPGFLQAQAGDGRIYVNRIVFLGTDRINDKLLRRELSQLEATHINTVALEQSRLRLERLPYVERAQVTLRPVKDAPDQVDVLITVTEAPARRYGGGGGYSNRIESVFMATLSTRIYSARVSVSPLGLMRASFIPLHNFRIQNHMFVRTESVEPLRSRRGGSIS